MIACNLKNISLPQDNSQHIISQYVDDTSCMVKGGETNVDHLFGILHEFGNTSGLEINLHKNVAY